MRVAVEAGRGTVGGPTSVGNAGVGIENLVERRLRLLNELLELGDLADLFESKDFVLLVAVDGETSGIVATVLETGET